MLNTVQALPNVGPVCMEPYSFVIAWHNDYENTLASAPDNTIMLFLVGLSPTYQALPGNPPPHLQRDNVITAYQDHMMARSASTDWAPIEFIVNHYLSWAICHMLVLSAH